MKTKVRLGLWLKLYKNGKTIFDTHLRMKDRVIAHAQKRMWDRGYLKVTYKRGVYNDMDFYDLKSLKKGLSAFTEKDLVNDLLS
jgi:hypothetical protein